MDRQFRVAWIVATGLVWLLGCQARKFDMLSSRKDSSTAKSVPALNAQPSAIDVAFFFPEAGMFKDEDLSQWTVRLDDGGQHGKFLSRESFQFSYVSKGTKPQ